MGLKKVKNLLLIVLIVFSVSCSKEDIELEEENSIEFNQKASDVNFAIDPDTGKIFENLPVEILDLLIKDLERIGDFEKIERVKKTYDFSTGSLTKNALNSDKFKNHVNTKLAQQTTQFRAHVAGNGWLEWKTYNEIVGTTGEGRRMEALEFKAFPIALIEQLGRVHVAGIGWMDKEYGPNALLGTTGQNRRMEAFQLMNIPAGGYHYYYQAHVAGYGWLPWQTPYGIAGTTGQSRQMEAFRMMRVYM